jgi:hypothetical protein
MDSYSSQLSKHFLGILNKIINSATSHRHCYEACLQEEVLQLVATYMLCLISIFSSSSSMQKSTSEAHTVRKSLRYKGLKEKLYVRPGPCSGCTHCNLDSSLQIGKLDTIKTCVHPPDVARGECHADNEDTRCQLREYERN